MGIVEAQGTDERSEPGDQLCAEPRVEMAKHFLSETEAGHLIALARDRLGEAGVSLDSGIGKSSGRTAWNAWIPHDHDAVVHGLCQRLAALAGHPLAHAESLQVVCYEPGGEYRAHFDAYDISTERGQRYTERGGQRLCTAILYLNDVEAGGKTRFPRLDLSIRPELGNVLVFDSCEAGTRRVHPLALHASEPLEAGEKWIANLWFRERPYL